MATAKTVLSLLTVLCAYGVVGRMDYEDSLMTESAHKQPVQTDCSSDIPHSFADQAARTSATNEAVMVPPGGCDARRY